MLPRTNRTATAILIIVALALAAAACSKAETPPEPTATETGTETETPVDSSKVVVDITDSSLTVAPDTIATGEITFEATNSGTMTHEFEIFSGDADPAALPVDNSVANTERLTLIGEAEDIIPGGQAVLTETLEPGSYVLICNLPGHYEMGLYTGLTVT